MNQAIRPTKLKAPPALVESAKGRTNSVVVRLTAAMKKMKEEIHANDGIYPFNKGRITQSEVCRRAGVSKATLQGPAHKDTTKLDVDAWVEVESSAALTGHRTIRKAITHRADDWKAAHDAIANSYHLDQLVLTEARQRIKQLEADNQALREQLALGSASKVTALAGGKT